MALCTLCWERHTVPYSPLTHVLALCYARKHLLALVANMLAQSKLWTLMATRHDSVAIEVRRGYLRGSFTIHDNRERGGCGTRTRNAIKPSTATSEMRHQQEDQATELDEEGGHNAAAQAERSHAEILSTDAHAQGEPGAGAGAEAGAGAGAEDEEEATASLSRTPPQPAARAEIQREEGVFDNHADERIFDAKEAVDVAAEQVRTLFEPYGLADLHDFLRRSVVLERELHEAVEKTRADAEAARADQERKKQVEMARKASEYMRDRAEDLARSGLDTQGIMARCLEMAQAALSSAAGSGSADAAETPAQINADKEIDAMRKKRKALCDAMDRLGSSVDSGEARLKALKTAGAE